MSVPENEPRGRRLLVAAGGAAAVTATGFVVADGLRAAALSRAPDTVGALVRGALAGWLSTTVTYVPFLLAVLLVVARATRRTVAGAVGLVYVADLLLVPVWGFVSGVPVGVGPTLLAVPLDRVVAVLAVATAAWLAHHGGYERLVAAVGEVPQHPLFAAVADERIGPGLTVHRGLVVAVLAGAVGAGGLVSAGWAADLLGAVARATGGSGAPFFAGRWQMGIPPTRLPVEWLFEASFLLAVVLVTGPRLRARAVATGVAVVVAVQSTVALLPMLVPPSEPVFLLAPSGPVLTPLGDVVVLLGIAVGVRVGLHDGGGRLRYPGGSRTDRRGT